MTSNTPFQRHEARRLAPPRSWGKRATINGRPAWQVVEERKGKRDEH